MKDYLKIILILCAGIAVSAAPYLPANPSTQAMLAALARKKAGAGGGAVATDDFESQAHLSLLENDSDWTAIEGSVQVRDPIANGFIINAAADDACVVWTSTSFNSNQYSQAFLTEAEPANNRQLGVSVRGQETDNYYRAVYQENGTTIYLDVVEASVETELTTVTQALDVGHGIRLEVTGAGSATRLTVKVDTGSGFTAVITSHDPGSGNYYDGGDPGVAFVSNFTTTALDDWEGGDL